LLHLNAWREDNQTRLQGVFAHRPLLQNSPS
jgi:hypothetical protein